MAEQIEFPMRAATRFGLSAPRDVMRQLCDHFVEHCDVIVDGDKARLVAEFGTAILECDDSRMSVQAFGYDESTLSYVKMMVVEHVLEYAPSDKPDIVWRGDGVTGGPLPFFREMRVVGARDVTPNMRRVRLAGEDIARFASGGLHIRLLFPASGLAEISWPTLGADGRIVWPTGAAKLTGRIYTIRSIDVAKGEMDVDFVIHEGDAYPGAGFAVKAKPGDIVGITGPGGGVTPSADWVLLAGDETALPAIGRMLEELPASVQAVVRVEIPDAAEEQRLASAAGLDLAWLHRGEAKAGTTTLLEDAVRGVAIPDDGRSVFVWAGGEHKTFRSLRKYLRGERGLTRQQHMVAAFWRRGFDGDSPEAEEA
ncbi:MULTISPECIES: siderophore-interacting protein [Rhodomicrobium]|uniref:siderophore-interacting protein n=1 Tax=Rhodomicrobium TaxID=1068 RepID=UPI000B4A69D3|nr:MULTISPECIES: siderophore-interacting protein [Rhodomicrobium]